MATTDFQSVDEYVASLPKEVRAILKSVRGAIHKALPNAEDVISYQIAATKVDGRLVLYFAGWKRHYSLYPATTALREAFKRELASYDVNDKGTIRFPLDEPVPTTLIGRIAKFRAKEVSERAASKRKAKSAKNAKAPTKSATRAKKNAARPVKKRSARSRMSSK